MARVNELITLGIGTPSSIPYLVLTGLGTNTFSRGYNEMMLIGEGMILTAGVVYALPARRRLIRVQQSGGTIECSNDGITFAAITLDDDEQFESAARFIKAVTTDALVVSAV